jgi:hypothetical protein
VAEPEKPRHFVAEADPNGFKLLNRHLLGSKTEQSDGRWWNVPLDHGLRVLQLAACRCPRKSLGTETALWVLRWR